jgi:hypothetical protein
MKKLSAWARAKRFDVKSDDRNESLASASGENAHDQPKDREYRQGSKAADTRRECDGPTSLPMDV